MNYNILINHEYFLYITNLFDFDFEFEFDLRGKLFGKEVCDAVVAKCLTGRRKTVEKAHAVFLLFVELEAVDAFLVLFFMCIWSHCLAIPLQYSTWGLHSSFMIMVSDIHIKIIFLSSCLTYDSIEWLASGSGFSQYLYSIFQIALWKYFDIYGAFDLSCNTF
jgi:hypothetical protein